MVRPAIIDIHPDGDVVLLCGDGLDEDPKPLRVSSMILAHASPVFKALLGPHFREGNTFAASSSVEIPLPDDDPDVMEAICLVLHMRNEDVSSYTTKNELITLVNHCDKYNILAAMRPVLNLWLDDCLDASPDYDTAEELMVIAFNLKLWRSVNRLGLIMIKRAHGAITADDDLEIVLPKMIFHIYDQLEEHRERTSRKIYAAIEDEVDSFLHHTKRTGTCNSDCEGVNASKRNLIKQLRNKYLWPAKRVFGRSLINIEKRIAVYDFIDIINTKKCRPDCMVSSMKGTRQVARLIESAVTKILDELTRDITFTPSEEEGVVLGFSNSGSGY